jgi:hypothetical protein
MHTWKHLDPIQTDMFMHTNIFAGLYTENDSINVSSHLLGVYKYGVM